MLDPKLRVELDQGRALISETVPPLCRSLYLGFIDQGFTEAEAMELIKAYIASMGK